MADWGIKVANTGVDVGTALANTLAMSSDFTMFKLHSDGTAYGTIQPGQSSGTVSFTHNLGYVPVFWVYFIDQDGNQRLYSNTNEGIEVLDWISASSGTNTITCSLNLTYNWNEINKIAPYDGYNTYDGNYNIGMLGQINGNHQSTGFVFYPMAEVSIFYGTLVDLPQGATISSAQLSYGVNSKGTNNADGTMSTHGVKFDYGTSIGDLNAEQTSGSTVQTVGGIGTGESFGINVTSAVQEIVNQAGWTSGTGMHFHLRDINFPTEKWYRDIAGAPTTNLVVRKSGNLTFGFRVVIFKDKVF